MTKKEREKICNAIKKTGLLKKFIAKECGMSSADISYITLKKYEGKRILYKKRLLLMEYLGI